jgi:galactokinase
LIDADHLHDDFVRLHGRAPRMFAAPGRVNLIGEHTDYNDGFVLPVAIDRETIVAAARRDDRIIHVRSINADETLEFDLDAEPQKRRGIWLDYIEGVARAIESGGERLAGADLLLESDVPEGAGLSSSAALEISTGLALQTLAGNEFDPIRLALAGQKAEHEYVGTMSGIMDQFIASLGRAGHALLIDCRSLEATPIPMNGSDVALVICDTRVKHSLASSEYNTRRSECEHGVEILRNDLPGIRALRDVSLDEFERLEDRLPDPIDRRCRHVITENARTLRAAEALRNGDLETMGMLMAESHRSLRDDYEVSCEELDKLVEIAGEVDGVLGARMTGGGFGGCTINIVRRNALEDLCRAVSRRYYDAMKLEPAIYISEASDGAREII